jgi:hypothetical protein
MTASYTLPYDLQDLSMANNDFLPYGDDSVNNIFGLSNTPRVDQIDDLLWNFEYSNFADDDTDSKLLDTSSYDISTEVR